MSFPSRLITLVLAVAPLALGACVQDRAKVSPTSYFGPTETMSEVTAKINANNSAVQTLWADVYFEARIPKEPFVNTGGTLLYMAPNQMRLAGTKEFVDKPVFQIGSTEDRYWMIVSPPNGKSQMWWGWHRNIGKPCVDEKQVPIRPDLVMQVLGIAAINTNFLEPPVPTMRFNNEADAYMFVWNAPAGNRWAAQKEIWYDRKTKLPSRVFLFDANGRVVLRARLSGHAPMDMPDVPEDKRPKIARSYKLFFPDTGATMDMELKDVEPEHRGAPTRTGIKFPDVNKFDESIQLDENCPE